METAPKNGVSQNLLVGAVAEVSLGDTPACDYMPVAQQSQFSRTINFPYLGSWAGVTHSKLRCFRF
jgi:hypothetical protein